MKAAKGKGKPKFKVGQVVRDKQFGTYVRVTKAAPFDVHGQIRVIEGHSGKGFIYPTNQRNLCKLTARERGSSCPR